jgi:rhodanese-related sulfurtransferase
LLLDVRDETDFNVFHLVDAHHVALADLEGRLADEISPESVVVVVSNDEARAEQAWRRLSVQGNVNAYILAGGINRWLDVYYDKRANVPGPEIAATGNDSLRHRFAQSVGERPAAARPKTDQAPKRAFVTKVQVLGPVREVGGGCG